MSLRYYDRCVRLEREIDALSAQRAELPADRDGIPPSQRAQIMAAVRRSDQRITATEGEARRCWLSGAPY